MKKYFISLALVALAILVSCNKEEVNTTTDTTAQTEFITVELNPQTKTSLSGVNTQWEDGDKVSVTVNGEVIGTLNYVEGSTFTGEIEAGHDGAAEVLLHYPAGVNEVPVTQDAVAGSFANGAALLDGTTTIADLRAGIAAKLTNKTALISFTPKVGGDVVFTLGEATYTVKACEAGENYYVCVPPVDGVALSYTADGKEGAKSKPSVSFEAGKVYYLGELDILEDAVIRIKNMNEWGDLSITVVSGSTTLVDKKSMTNEGNDIFTYRLDKEYVGKEVKYYINHSWYQTSTKDVTLAADSKAEPVVLNTTYLQPNAWNAASPRYGAHIWVTGKGGIWVSATKVLDNFYEVEVPSDVEYNNIIWCRMNPNNKTNDWGAVWNQTGDLTLKHKCYCIQDSDAWNKPTADYWY